MLRGGGFAGRCNGREVENKSTRGRQWIAMIDDLKKRK